MAAHDETQSSAVGLQDMHMHMHNNDNNNNNHHSINGEDLKARVPKPTGMVSQVPIPPYTKLANPGPLGLIGFALTTFVLGLYQCGAGWVASKHLSTQLGISLDLLISTAIQITKFQSRGHCWARPSSVRACHLHGWLRTVRRWHHGIPGGQYIWHNRTLLLRRLLAQLCHVLDPIPQYQGCLCRGRQSLFFRPRNLSHSLVLPDPAVPCRCVEDQLDYH